MTDPARTGQERKRDTLKRLENDVDAWVATADDGMPYLVPLSFLWDGVWLLMSTMAGSPTGRALRSTGRARVSLGPTRDVVLIDATVETFSLDEVTTEVGDAFAVKTGFDPRDDPDSLFFQVRPQRIQAWREVNELKGRTLMRDGHWLL